MNIGLRAQKGGAVLVAVEGTQILYSGLLKTHQEGDPLSFEPYRVAFEMRKSPETAAMVTEGRRRQDRLAAEALRQWIEQIGRPVVAALLINRAGWISDLLEYSLDWAEHVPVAELLAVRQALRYATDQCGIRRVELDEKSLPAMAAANKLEPPLKPPAFKPWRKEQKLACLAAQVAAGS